MNTSRSVARFASCRPLKSLLGKPQLVRSLSCSHFSMVNRKAAGAAQSKSTFIAEYQNGLSLNPLCPKGYSQGPKDGKQGQEALNQLQDKLAYSSKQRENDQDPSSSKHDGDDIIDGEHQKKGAISGIEEEKVKDGNGQNPSGANKKETLVQPHRTIDTDAICKNEEELMKIESKNLAKKDSTVKDQEEKLTEEMKEKQEGELKKKEEEDEDELKKEQEELQREKEKMKKELQEQMKKDKLRQELMEELKKEEEEKMKNSWRKTFAKFNPKKLSQNAKTIVRLIPFGTIMYYLWLTCGLYGHSREAAKKKAKGADLIIKEDLSNLLKVLSFIGNKKWNLEAHFAGYADAQRFSIEDKKVLYIHGDPGIGKSTAFTSLVHNMNDGSPQVRANLKAAFPFLTEFKHFIYIDVSKYSFDMYGYSMAIIAGCIRLWSKEALVIFDDAHQIFETGKSKETKFYNVLNKATGVKCIVLLSSQGPRPKHPYLKDTDIHQECLYELDMIEAIVQLQNGIRLYDNIRPGFPVSLSKQLAHRLWFYLGGNFRSYKAPLKPLVSLKIDYLCKQSGSNALSEKTSQGPSKDMPAKSKFFPLILYYMQENHVDVDIEDLVQLNFSTESTKDKKPPTKSTTGQSNNRNDKLTILIESNILITKKMGSVKKITFHSRRAQYAFTYWLGFEYPQYWDGKKDNDQAYLSFLKVLERAECRHILSFPLLPFQEELERNRVQKLDFIAKIFKNLTKEQREKVLATNRRMEVDPVTVQSIEELMKDQLELVMLYFEAYQQKNRKLDSFSSYNSQLKVIMDDLKKGHAHFYSQYGGKFKMSQKQKEKMQDLKAKISKKSTAEVLKVKDQILGALYDQCVSDFMELGQFKKKGVPITEEDLKNCVRGEETGKYNDIKEQIEKVYGQDPVTKTRQEMLEMSLDLIVDLNYHMKFWDLEKIEEGAQKEKAAKKSP